jgi:hypothetical protein
MIGITSRGRGGCRSGGGRYRQANVRACFVLADLLCGSSGSPADEVPDES